jgi:hypothetical protein
MEAAQPDMHRLLLGVAVMVAMLTAMGLLRMIVDRNLAPDDPRRRFIAQLLLYGGTAIFVLVMLWLRG